ncbi:hypothetical protein PPERSA_09878 [Pseudocohnilembus persalinus]|uniref:Uncharacterized protein n=1 Tax=Pseudocohnilembus persalinus TaxID=266149 RepID=A0A0V0QUM3_PSEPJ|nr:hypothetical protein PPERSA_09878 [Pseudocohnilembus persalinus]|eukprot:KRX05738.1 hypothetical protein PPERSA_09878 [Pseudocohnilembus persalinus]
MQKDLLQRDKNAQSNINRQSMQDLENAKLSKNQGNFQTGQEFKENDKSQRLLATNQNSHENQQVFSNSQIIEINKQNQNIFESVVLEQEGFSQQQQQLESQSNMQKTQENYLMSKLESNSNNNQKSFKINPQSNNQYQGNIQKLQNIQNQQKYDEKSNQNQKCQQNLIFHPLNQQNRNQKLSYIQNINIKKNYERISQKLQRNIQEKKKRKYFCKKIQENYPDLIISSHNSLYEQKSLKNMQNIDSPFNSFHSKDYNQKNSTSNNQHQQIQFINQIQKQHLQQQQKQQKLDLFYKLSNEQDNFLDKQQKLSIKLNHQKEFKEDKSFSTISPCQSDFYFGYSDIQLIEQSKKNKNNNKSQNLRGQFGEQNYESRQLLKCKKSKSNQEQIDQISEKNDNYDDNYNNIHFQSNNQLICISKRQQQDDDNQFQNLIKQNEKSHYNQNCYRQKNKSQYNNGSFQKPVNNQYILQKEAGLSIFGKNLQNTSLSVEIQQNINSENQGYSLINENMLLKQNSGSDQIKSQQNTQNLNEQLQYVKEGQSQAEEISEQNNKINKNLKQQIFFEIEKDKNTYPFQEKTDQMKNYQIQKSDSQVKLQKNQLCNDKQISDTNSNSDEDSINSNDDMDEEVFKNVIYENQIWNQDESERESQSSSSSQNSSFIVEQCNKKKQGKNQTQGYNIENQKQILKSYNKNGLNQSQNQILNSVENIAKKQNNGYILKNDNGSQNQLICDYNQVNEQNDQKNATFFTLLSLPKDEDNKNQNKLKSFSSDDDDKKLAQQQYFKQKSKQKIFGMLDKVMNKLDSDDYWSSKNFAYNKNKKEIQDRIPDNNHYKDQNQNQESLCKNKKKEKSENQNQSSDNSQENKICSLSHIKDESTPKNEVYLQQNIFCLQKKNEDNQKIDQINVSQNSDNSRSNKIKNFLVSKNQGISFSSYKEGYSSGSETVNKPILPVQQDNNQGQSIEADISNNSKSKSKQNPPQTNYSNSKINKEIECNKLQNSKEIIIMDDNQKISIISTDDYNNRQNIKQLQESNDSKIFNKDTELKNQKNQKNQEIKDSLNKKKNSCESKIQNQQPVLKDDIQYNQKSNHFLQNNCNNCESIDQLSASQEKTENTIIKNQINQQLQIGTIQQQQNDQIQQILGQKQINLDQACDQLLQPAYNQQNLLHQGNLLMICPKKNQEIDEQQQYQQQLQTDSQSDNQDYDNNCLSIENYFNQDQDLNSDELQICQQIVLGHNK